MYGIANAGIDFSICIAKIYLFQFSDSLGINKFSCYSYPIHISYEGIIKNVPV